jgi:hypothetical protein
MTCEPKICFAVDTLFENVVASFKEERIEIPNNFGWRELNKHKAAHSRIVWIPGDENGRVGDTGAPRDVGGNPRAIAQTNELFTVYFSSFDASAPEDELVQYREAKRIFHLWYLAAYRAAYGTFEIVDQFWDVSKKERQHGLMSSALVAIQAPIFDDVHALVPADAEPDISTSIGEDLSEPTIEPED